MFHFVSMDGGLMKSMGYMMGRENENAPVLRYPRSCSLQVPDFTKCPGLGG